MTTGAPAGHEVRTTALSVNQLRLSGSDGESFVARAFRDAVRRLGLEMSGADVAGIAVHIAFRIQNWRTPEKSW